MKLNTSIATIFAAFFLVGCQTLDGNAARADIGGIYYLESVDGLTVPADVRHDDTVLRVLAGTFIISDDGTCFSRTRFVAPDGSEVTREAHARYQVDDAGLTMRWAGAGTTTGTAKDGTFVMDNHGMIFAYRRSG